MRRIALVAAMFTGVIPAGCATVSPVASTAVGLSGFSYSAGRATQGFALPMTSVETAATGAMDDLRIHSVRQTHDGSNRIIEGTTADNRRATVTLNPNQAGTRVTARIGWFGDEPLSKALMDRIGIRLGTLPPAAIPVDPPSSPGSNPFFSRTAVSDATMLHDQMEAPYRDTLVPDVPHYDSLTP